MRKTLEEETTRFLDAWMQVRQLVQAANFNRFHRAGLSATQFMTLNVMTKEGVTLSELARRLNLSPATLNETINSLAERMLVQRTPNLLDRRKVNISITAEGEQMQNAASREFRGYIAGLFASMSKTKRDGLLAGLEQIVKLSKSEAEAAPPTSRFDDALPEKRSSQ